MQPELREARKMLNESTLTEFTELVKEAKLLPLTEDILRKRTLLGKSICQLSMEFNLSESAVRKRLHDAYDRIAHLDSVFKSFHRLTAIVCILVFMGQLNRVI